MAVSSIAIPTDAARDKKAAELAKTAHTWPVVTLKRAHGSFEAGTRFRQTPNGYRVNAVACECKDYLVAGNICKHIRTIVLLEQRPAVREVKSRYAEVFGICDAKGCDEDRARGERYCDRHILVDCF